MKKESPANSSGSLDADGCFNNAETESLDSTVICATEGFGKRCIMESTKKTQEDEKTSNKSCNGELFGAFGNIPKRMRGSCGSIDSSFFDIYNAARILTEMKKSSSSCAAKQEKQEEEVKKHTKKSGKPSSEYGNNGEEDDDDDDDDEDDDDNDDQGKKKKQKGKKTDHPQAPPLSTYMLNYIKHELGGSQCDPVLIIMKKVTKTDTNSKNARFSMPKSQVRSLSCLLTKKEKKVLSVKNKKVKVRLILPCLYQIQMNLTWWEMGKSKSYMLNGSWGKVATDEVMVKNGLKEGIMVQVWGFRSILGDLFMAIVRVQEEEDNNGDDHEHAGNAVDIASSSNQKA